MNLVLAINLRSLLSLALTAWGGIIYVIQKWHRSRNKLAFIVKLGISV